MERVLKFEVISLNTKQVMVMISEINEFILIKNL